MTEFRAPEAIAVTDVLRRYQRREPLLPPRIVPAGAQPIATDDLLGIARKLGDRAYFATRTGHGGHVRVGPFEPPYAGNVPEAA